MAASRKENTPIGPSSRAATNTLSFDHGYFQPCAGPVSGRPFEVNPVVAGTHIGYDDPRLHVQRRDSTFSDNSYGLYSLGLGGVGGLCAAEKFPEIEVTDHSFRAALAPLSMSSASSTASRSSSVGSLLSPVQTDFASQPDIWPTRSRGPSPLRNAVRNPASPTDTSSTVDFEGQYLCLAPGCDSKFPNEKGLESHVKATHSHVCLWGSNGPCDSGGFATRDELNWHVKCEHLLICPVPGCTLPLNTVSESSGKDVLDCHMRWAHKGVGPQTASSNLLGPAPMQKPEALDTEKIEEKPRLAHTELAKDRILKMEMSIGISKKRCREQLKRVIDKKLKKSNVSTPRAGESPGMIRTRSPKVLDTANFPIVWEHGVLPFLIEFIPRWCGPGHTISVSRGKKRDSRRICFMTQNQLSMARKFMIAGHVRDLLPESHRDNVTFMFSVGEVDRLVWARGLGKDMPDEVCAPRNPFCYINPCMGDSIGSVLDDGDDVTATLGPSLIVGGGTYWLASFHPFIEANQTGSPVMVEHPSPADRDLCTAENHDALSSQGVDFKVGNIAATSGHDLKTTRLSHDPYWEECEKEPPLVVTDWTLISNQTKQANMLRKLPSGGGQKQEVPVTKMSCVSPGADVYSTGRTSGYQRGQVCDIPAYIDGKVNGTGKATREWFIEEPYPYDNDNEWIRGGIGVQGDSGAAIVDRDSNALVGQLWGRNKYFGSGPRLTYFTPIIDIFDDIQERCGEQTRPQLPQYRDEAYRFLEYPVCRPCFDLREYLDSRRTSRASLFSISGAGASGEKDLDLNSVSELATPKAVVDQSNWYRHSGTEEIGSSFKSIDSILSPTPINSFYYNPHANSPAAIEVRSPYALTLQDEDLYENACPDKAEVGLGKRPAVPSVMARNGSQQSGKKRRIA